jgi:hypothetical protein
MNNAKIMEAAALVFLAAADWRDGGSTVPKKTTDNRAFNGETCQCEAIAPDVLSQIVAYALEDRTDRDALNDVSTRI